MHTIPTAAAPGLRFARLVYALAGIYGLLVMTPQYWLETRIGRDTPPAITHPEYFYGFIGICIAWQLAFLLIARDPVRYRLFIPITIIEKLGFGIPVIVLHAQQRLTSSVLGFGILDLVLGTLFAMAWMATRPARASAA